MKSATHLIIALLCPFILQAQSPGTSTVKASDEIVISDALPGNAYLAGSKVQVNAPVNGDLAAAAGTVVVTDSIKNDALITAGNVRITGPVGEDLRVTAGDVQIQSNIGGDLVIGSGNVLIARDVVIYGDLLAGSGNLVVNGTVKGTFRAGTGNTGFYGIAEGDFIARGANLRLDGEIRGTAEISAEEIELGTNSKFYKDVRYWTPDGELDFSGILGEGATASYDPSLKTITEGFNWENVGMGAVSLWVWRLISSSLLIALLIALFPGFFSQAVDHFYRAYLNKFGWGMLYLLLVPVAIVVLLITVVGIPVGLILMSIYAATIVFSHSLTAVIASFEVRRRRDATWSTGMQILVAIGLFIVIKLLSSIPFIGWIFSLTVIAIALGSVWMYLIQREDQQEELA